MIFDDSNNPEYQKFKVDKLPTILRFEKVDYILLLAYYKHKYNKSVKPVQRRNGKSIPPRTNYATKPLVFICPYCGATLTEQKQRKHFKIHKCNNSKCSYHQNNLKSLNKL